MLIGVFVQCEAHPTVPLGYHRYLVLALAIIIKADDLPLNRSLPLQVSLPTSLQVGCGILQIVHCLLFEYNWLKRGDIFGSRQIRGPANTIGYFPATNVFQHFNGCFAHIAVKALFEIIRNFVCVLFALSLLSKEETACDSF